jgi:serine/threonine protein phosphatase PrpC
MRQDTGSKREDGCTAVTLVVFQHRLIISNVGDSRAVLCRGGQGECDHRSWNG